MCVCVCVCVCVCGVSYAIEGIKSNDKLSSEMLGGGHEVLLSSASVFVLWYYLYSGICTLVFVLWYLYSGTIKASKLRST